MNPPPDDLRLPAVAPAGRPASAGPATRRPEVAEPPVPSVLRWLVAAAVVLFAVALPKPLAIDEESYRWLGSVLDPAKPYAWYRAWQGGNGEIYAHPPLFLWWMWAWSGVESLPLARLSGLPWVVLWAGASAVWMRRSAQHPEVAAFAWLGSATVWLGLQDSLMIDLPWVALTTAALAGYREGLARRDGRWFLAAGLALGAAVETKYPAAVVVPVLLVHGLRWGFPLAFWLPAALVVGGVEGWLHAESGVWHPLLVWENRGVVAHGPLDGRALGVLARAALLPCGLGLLYTRPVHAAVGAALAVAGVAWVRPAGLEASGVALLIGCAAVGGALLARAGAALAVGPGRRRKGDRDDSLLLGGVMVATALGVVFFHNYASARYLLPAATPAAIALARSAEDVAHGKRVQLVASALGALLAMGLAIADWQFCRAGREAAQGALVAAEAEGGGPGLFAAEWSARAELEAAGWQRLVDPEGLPAGTLVIALANSGGAVPDSWVPLASARGEGQFPLRVVDVQGHVGLYAETLGVLPFGTGGRPLEVAVLYRVGP